MLSSFQSRRTDETGSGGKILRSRRFAVSASSPFLRPKSPPSPENPSFLCSFFTGAGKLLSSLFSSSPSSSSSSSASDICSASGDNGDENDDVYNMDEDDDHVSNRCFNGAEELNQDFALGSQPIVQKSDAKLAIEQLITQETFSRDECIRLTKIIQSRVVNCPTMKENVDATQQELHDRTANLPDLCHASIEAKKWFEEKKLESSTNLDWDRGPCTLNTAMLPNVTEDELGSPIVTDKFCMEARLPWMSPSLSSIGFKTLSRMIPYNDETQYTNASCSFSSPQVSEDSWQMDSDSNSDKYCIPDSASMQYNEIANIEWKGMPPGVNCPFSSEADGCGTNQNDAHVSTLHITFPVEKSLQSKNSSQLPLFGLKATTPLPDSRSQGSDNQMHTEVSGLENRVPANGFFSKSCSSAVLEGPGFCDKKPWKSVDFSHGEFTSEHPKETCKLVTEMSIDFPAAIGTNDRNVTNGSDICTSSELSWLHQVEPLPNSSNGLARNSIKTFSNKGKKLVTYRRSREQVKFEGATGDEMTYISKSSNQQLVVESPATLARSVQEI